MTRDALLDSVGIAARLGVVGAVVVASVLSGAEVEAMDATAGEFDRLVDEIEQPDAHRAERLAAADLIGELRPYLVPSDYVDQLRETARRVDDPLVEFMLQRRAARAELEYADEPATTHDAFADEQSCLVDWQLVGPFENDAMQGFDDRLGPELGEEGPYSGRLTEVDWRELNSSHHLCNLRLHSRVHPSTSAVAYLATSVEIDSRQDAKLLVGSRSAYRIWVNGEPVGQRTSEDGFGVDAEGWSIRLEPGDNDILVKLGSSGQGGLSWMARLVGADGSGFDGWTSHPQPPNQRVDPFEPQGRPDGGARSLVEGGTEADDPGVKLAAAMLWKRLYPRDTETPWRDVAGELSEYTDQLSARQLLWLSRLYDELWRRQAVLDEALEEHGDDPLVVWARAEQRGDTLSALEHREQRRELEALLEEHPNFLLAVDSLASWHNRHESAHAALPVIEQWDHPEREIVPAWVRTAARLHETAGDERHAEQLREQAASTNRLTGSYSREMMRRRLADDDFEGAARLVEDYLQRAPWSNSWALREAMLSRADGDLDRALAVLDELIARSPGNARLRMRRAELLRAAGEDEAAMQTVESAIERRPQATRYQRYLEHLQPESTRFYDAWEITDLRELHDQAGETTHSWDRLVDQTVHQVASNGLSSEYNQRAHRVHDERGINSARRMRVSFTPGDERVEVLGVRVYKPDGTISEDYDDWQTSSTRQGARRYNDRGYVNLRANNVDVGDIVEFQYVVHQVANENFRGDYFGDVSYVQSTRPIIKSRYAVHYPEDWELHFRAPAIDHDRWQNETPGGEPVDGQRVEAFELRDVPRVHTENDQPGNTDVYDYILVSNKETFDEVGTWWWELIEEQMVVDHDIRNTVESLTEGLEDDTEILEAIYEYVVRNTRYLHVGLGIHGWKPYRTTSVFRNQYGDCKDKAALLKVMLEEAGIETQMVLVRTRRLGAVEDYPPSMNIFNHAVAYVPSKDLFLDPTARFNGPWELTQMDQGAQALIIEDGGDTEWLQMPVDDAGDNLRETTLRVDYRADTPIMEGQVEAHGAEAVRDRRGFEDPERRDEDLEDRLRSRFSGLSLTEADYDNLDSLTAPSSIDYTAEVPGAGDGGELSSVLPLVEPLELLDRHARHSTRRQDLTFRVPFARQYRVHHRLPEHRSVERLPDATELDSPFGSMHIDYEYDGDELAVDLAYSIDVQRVDVDDYPEFRQFVAEMDEAVNETIRLVDNERN